MPDSTLNRRSVALYVAKPTQFSYPQETAELPKNPAAKKAATSSCGRHNMSGITSANAFHSKIAADRKVEPPIPHSSVTQRWGARSINRCDHHEFAGASGAAGVSVRWGLASSRISPPRRGFRHGLFGLRIWSRYLSRAAR